MMRGLGDKADSDEVRALSQRLGKALEQLHLLLQRGSAWQQESETLEENAAIFRLPVLPGRCLSCSKRVEVAVDRAGAWHRQEAQGSPWPSRAPSQQSSRPRRDSSLPSIGRDGGS
jgi:hypothetical protein